jgi:hypothetical protein
VQKARSDSVAPRQRGEAATSSTLARLVRSRSDTTHKAVPIDANFSKKNVRNYAITIEPKTIDPHQWLVKTLAPIKPASKININKRSVFGQYRFLD